MSLSNNAIIERQRASHLVGRACAHSCSKVLRFHSSSDKLLFSCYDVVVTVSALLLLLLLLLFIINSRRRGGSPRFTINSTHVSKAVNRRVFSKYDRGRWNCSTNSKRVRAWLKRWKSVYCRRGKALNQISEREREKEKSDKDDILPCGALNIRNIASCPRFRHSKSNDRLSSDNLSRNLHCG